MTTIAKNKFRWIILITVAVAVLAVFLLNTSKQPIVNATGQKYVVSQGKIKEYQDFDHLDAETGIVIRGIKTGVAQTILQKNEDGQVTDKRTISNFSVGKVYKDNTGLINKGGNILVQENAAAEESIVYSTEGYQLMNTDQEYLLFLRPSLTEPNVYIIKGVYYGKVPTNSQNDLQFKGSDKEKGKLEEVYSSALNKYN